MASKNGAKNGVSAEVKGSALVITVPLAAKGTQSATGKSTILASTNGNVDVVVAGQIAKLGVNCYVKNAR
jgi:hypothetical protein